MERVLQVKEEGGRWEEQRDRDRQVEIKEGKKVKRWGESGEIDRKGRREGEKERDGESREEGRKEGYGES